MRNPVWLVCFLLLAGLAYQHINFTREIETRDEVIEILTEGIDSVSQPKVEPKKPAPPAFDPRLII